MPKLLPGQQCVMPVAECNNEHFWDQENEDWWNTEEAKRWWPRCKEIGEPTSTGSLAAQWLRKVADTLEKKAISYGDSVGNPMRIFSKAGVTEGIRVRIDDKLSRIARGSEWPGDDVVVDLVGYLALLAVTEK